MTFAINVAETSALMSETTSCPSCGSEVSVSPGFQPWCQKCGWGCANKVTPAEGAFERIYSQLGQRTGERLFEELSKSEFHVQKPKLTLSEILAHVLAAPVHLATAGLAVAGVWFLTVNWFHFVPFTIGLLLIGAAYALRPRFGKPPKHRLLRSDAPTLFGLMDDVARALGTEPVEEFYVEPEVDAYFGTHGLRQTQYLAIGSPLWQSFDGAGKIAVVAHELSHKVNGDVSRGFWIGTAITSLQSWLEFLRQSPMHEEEGGVLTHYLLLLVSVPFHLLLSAIVHLNWNASQRAEYLADYLASRVAGTSESIAALEHSAVMFAHGTELAEQTKKHALDPDRIIASFAAKFSSIPPLELERVRLLNSTELLVLDATHPPTHYRCRMLEAFPCEPAIGVTDEQSEKLNAEFAALNGAMGKEFVRHYMTELT